MFARVQDGQVAELFDALPTFTPDLMATIFPCDSSVQLGWLFDGTTFTAPVVVVVVPPTAQELVDEVMAEPYTPTSVFMRGLVVLLAQKFNVTQQQVVTAIRNAAS